MEGKKTRITTIRLPVELYERITLLARKRLCSVNAWIVRTLSREAHLKPLESNPGAPHKDKNIEKGEQERG